MLAKETGPVEVDPTTTAPRPPGKSGQRIRRQFASASLDDSELGEVRGGFEAAPGVEFNFAFQQQTFVNQNLVQSVIVPTLTVTPSTAVVSLASSPFDFASAAAPTSGATNATTLNGAPVQTLAPRSVMLSTNGGVFQSIPSLPGVNAGGTTAVSTGLGTTGLANVITNTQNAQLVQQVTTIGIGVSGLQQLLRQTPTMSVLNRLNTGSIGLR